MKQSRVLFIVGPTGIGKTALSIKLAKRVKGEIVSADSRQIYKFMTIGTAKPTHEELASVPHHFIDIKTPDEYYSAGQFGSEARICIAEIRKREKQPIVVGGSGLYIRALMDGLFEPKIADELVKTNLKKEAGENGIAVLYDRLNTVDPKTAAKLHSTDSQRIMRALEVFEVTGEAFSNFVDLKPRPSEFEPCILGLTLERSELYERIEKRVEAMLERGFLDEVKELQKMGYRSELNSLQSVGYREAFLNLDDKLSISEMTALIKRKTRNYAKRQMTWFRKDKRIHWINLSKFGSINEIADFSQHLFESPVGQN
ncbi:tRNA (adenosine(37)-N6)-dimethylallyltransferase MiaA [candidate division KSB1 bacterium]|nr:tRNA (adenosine(37)-N6)-dimethylallyltransferase MiaA [candidate division KSB1 bacterium]